MEQTNNNRVKDSTMVLKRCPKCNSHYVSVKVVESADGNDKFAVRCLLCNYSGVSKSSAAATIVNWNSNVDYIWKTIWPSTMSAHDLV